MYRILTFFLVSFLYLEGVYHFNIFGLEGINPLMMLPAALLFAAVETVLVRCFKKRAINLLIMWVCMALNYLLFAIQLVYYNIFTRPLLLEVAFATGGDAITDFWSVALDGILRSMIPLGLMAVPFVVAAVLLHKDILRLKQYHKRNFIEAGAIAIVSVSVIALVLVYNYAKETDMYKEYQEL
jgi:hypothetical protein